jgi:hypothetical protein
MKIKMEEVITTTQLTALQIKQAEDSYESHPDTKNGVILFRVTSKFDNGFEMDIEIPNCREDEENYFNIVLFDKNGAELNCDYGDVGVILDDYTVMYDNKLYTTKLIENGGPS